MKYLIILIPVFILSCAAKKIIEHSSLNTESMESDKIMNDSLTIISMRKGGCYGKCPSYDFSINANGDMTFTSKRFCKKEGRFFKKLNQVETDSLFAKMRSIQIFEMEDNYKSRIADLPLIEISYQQDTLTKTVKGKLERPESLKKFQKTLESIAQTTDGWKKIEDTSVQQVPQYNFDELIVNLESNIDVNEWINQYKKYNMEIVKCLQDRANLYLIKYNQGSTAANKLLKILQKDSSVTSVSFNKRTKNR